MTQRSSPQNEPTPLFSVNMFASRSADGETLVIGGLSQDENQWAETLTRRAARALWFDLTRLLFPEKSDEVISQVATMPSLPRLDTEESAITVWTFVDGQADGGCVISGWLGYPGWSIRLSAYEVYRFWAALDTALFPTGW